MTGQTGLVGSTVNQVWFECGVSGSLVRRWLDDENDVDLSKVIVFPESSLGPAYRASWDTGHHQRHSQESRARFMGVISRNGAIYLWKYTIAYVVTYRDSETLNVFSPT